jgi:hypothetical protein
LRPDAQLLSRTSPIVLLVVRFKLVDSSLSFSPKSINVRSGKQPSSSSSSPKPRSSKPRLAEENKPEVECWLQADKEARLVEELVRLCVPPLLLTETDLLSVPRSLWTEADKEARLWTEADKEARLVEECWLTEDIEARLVEDACFLKPLRVEPLLVFADAKDSRLEDELVLLTVPRLRLTAANEESRLVEEVVRLTVPRLLVTVPLLLLTAANEESRLVEEMVRLTVPRLLATVAFPLSTEADECTDEDTRLGDEFCLHIESLRLKADGPWRGPSSPNPRFFKPRLGDDLLPLFLPFLLLEPDKQARLEQLERSSSPNPTSSKQRFLCVPLLLILSNEQPRLGASKF